MNKILLFYGPRQEFEKELPESYILLDRVIKISDLLSKVDKKLDLPKDCSIVGYSSSYSSITEGAEQNFANIIENFSDFVSYVYLQNPTKHIMEDILRFYGEEVVEVKYYNYPNITKDNILDFNSNFEEYVIGQPKVKNDLLSILYNLYKGKNKGKPVVLMFYGVSGVGKTETAKYLSKLLGGNLFRKQLSMFQGNEFIGYLFGGTHNESSFTKDILERKSNIILLDEFDKANPVFHSAFYQVFDEIEYEDKNYKVNLSNAIIICTSNYKDPNDIRKKLGDPIFYRFDKIIEFSDLDIPAKKKIIEKVVDEEYDNLDKNEKENLNLEDLKKNYLKYADMFENYRHTQALIKDDINKKLVKIFLDE